MPKSSKSTSYTFYVVLFPILIILAVIVLGGGYVASTQISNDSEEGSVLSKGDDKGNSKSDQGKPDNSDKSEKPEKSNNPGKGKIDKEPTTSQAKSHKKNLEEVIVTLNEVAEAEDAVGNEAVSDEIEEVADETEEIGNKTVEAVEKAEKRPKWRTILFGTDDKNLGQLRSTLSHSENAIRKLSRTQGTLQSSSSEDDVDDQIGILLLERERILDILRDNEDSFSILGWFSRFFGGGSGGDDQNGDDDTGQSTESTESTSSI